MEEKLTEGYARALTLEAERWRLERRLGQAARDLEGPGVSSRAEEVGSLGKRLESADGELTRPAHCSTRCTGAREPLRVALDDPGSHRVDRRLDAVVDLQLHQDVRDVVLDRLGADVKLARDHGVVLAVRDQLQHLDLTVREL